MSALLTSTELIVAAIHAWQAEVGPPLVVALDGHGAAGKTTLAGQVAAITGALVVHTDDYFREASAANTKSPREEHPMGRYYDWELMRVEAVGAARAHAPLVLVEGVSSASPALADLIDRAVLVDTPEDERLERLHGRITPEEWDEEWLAAERVYFRSRPAESFDLVVRGGG